MEDHEKEEWGGWKFVSDMLDNPDEFGIYQTSKCYKQLYDFVCEQKAKSYQAGIQEGREEERQFILNILDGVDKADEEMGNTGGGTLAIRHALQSRVIIIK